jgi:hypothetical protein
MIAYLNGNPYGYFELEANQRTYPDSLDDSDINFLNVGVKVNVNGFKGHFSCKIINNELGGSVA